MSHCPFLIPASKSAVLPCGKGAFSQEHEGTPAFALDCSDNTEAKVLQMSNWLPSSVQEWDHLREPGFQIEKYGKLPKSVLLSP